MVGGGEDLVKELESQRLVAFYVDENLSPSFAGVEGQNGMKMKGHQWANQTRRRDRRRRKQCRRREVCSH